MFQHNIMFQHNMILNTILCSNIISKVSSCIFYSLVYFYAVFIRQYLNWEIFNININDMFNRVIRIQVNWHISTGILTRIAPPIFIKIPVEMCQFTRFPMTRLNVSFILLNFSRCIMGLFPCIYQSLFTMGFYLYFQWLFMMGYYLYLLITI